MQKFTDPVFDTSPLSWAEWVFVGVVVLGAFWLAGLYFAIQPLV